MDLLTDKERGELMEGAGIEGSKLAGQMVSNVMASVDGPFSKLRGKPGARDATLLLIACGVADHIENEELI